MVDTSCTELVPCTELVRILGADGLVEGPPQLGNLILSVTAALRGDLSQYVSLSFWGANRQATLCQSLGRDAK